MPSVAANSLAGLLTATRCGDPAALGGLLRRLGPYVHALVRRRAGPNGGVDEPGVVRRTLGRLERDIGTLATTDVPQLLGRAGTVVAELVADELRAANRRPADLPTTLPGDFHDAEEQAARDEVAMRVASAVAALPERQRAAVESRFLDELPDAEAAARSGVTPGELRLARLHALRSLKLALEATA